ncbi:MAG: hypothetical protein WAO98_06730 [Alphaproteobacteria bacterium]
MNIIIPYGDLIPIRSVVKQWREVSAENLEAWREIVVRKYEAEHDVRTAVGETPDGLAEIHRILAGHDLWKQEEPPEFEFDTGISLTDAQRKDFDCGRIGKVKRMARTFLKDAFGELIDEPSFENKKNKVKPGEPQFAAHLWHRDPAPVVSFITNAFPMKLLRGAMPPNFPRRNHDCVVIGEYGDTNVIAEVNQWAASAGRLVEMPTYQLIIDVGQSWHCPSINTDEKPLPRTFQRGAGIFNFRRDTPQL